MAVDIGTGATVTFGTSGFSANLTSIEHTGAERGAVDTSHLGTTTARTFIPTDLYDPGSLELEINYEAALVAAATTGGLGDMLDEAAETVTVRFPVQTGDTTAGRFAASGFMTGYSVSNPLEELITANATFKLSGALTYTAGS